MQSNRALQCIQVLQWLSACTDGPQATDVCGQSINYIAGGYYIISQVCDGY